MSAREAQVRRAPGKKESRPPLRVVRRRSRRLILRGSSRRLAPLVIIGVIAVGALITTVLLEQVFLAQSAFKLTKIRTSLTGAEERHQELLVAASRLEDPSRIESYARRRLGMIDPLSVRYLVAALPGRGDPHVARGESKASLPATGRAAATGDPYDEGAP